MEEEGLVVAVVLHTRVPRRRCTMDPARSEARAKEGVTKEEAVVTETEGAETTEAGMAGAEEVGTRQNQNERTSR